MGVYNPRVPYILGEEWVPIREENIQFQPDVTAQELGYGFTLTSARQLNNARFYVNSLPANQPNNHNAVVNIYPAGQEALSGPIRKVVIPINNATLTGNGSLASFGGASLPDALYSPTDFKTVSFQSSPGPSALSGQFNAYFATNDYAQLLQGKRILNVSLLYSGYAQMQDDVGRIVAFRRIAAPNWIQSTLVEMMAPGGGNGFSYGTEIDSELGSLSGLANTVSDVAAGVGAQAAETIARLNLGDICPFFSGNLPSTVWTYNTLRRFDLRNGQDAQIYVLFQVPMPDVTVFTTSGYFVLSYMAMEVTYCNETRVATGSTVLFYNMGINTISMTDLASTTNPILPAGDYTATLSFVNPGDRAFLAGDISGPFAGINALREKIAISSLPGVEVDIPFPVFDKLGQTFTKKTTHVIPQITLHASGGPLTEPHVYGRQAVAHIWGANFATQNLLDSAVGGASSFPWVRFYARRFGNTTVPLVLSGSSPTVSGSSVSITPAQFDALDEILDGWKEITLRFPSAVPVMGAGDLPTWKWTAAGELAGNRWEVLGAMAPAVSGITSSPYNNPGPPSALLGVATYGQPSSGTSVEFTWMPGFMPYVSGATPDPNSDGVLIFSQDMPTVTGFSVATTSQPLTGVALDCNAYPWYVPTSLSYNRITWSATSSSVPVSGFAYYELQRMDTLTDWQTIAQVISPTGAAYSDYEARVGILTSYRIRAVNSLLFPGPWSSTISGTLPAPGVTGQGMGSDARTLIFTTNSRQDGSRNLAYAIAFESGDTTEGFAFPEAGFTQFQFMYGRDYQTAFRPLERGGTTFQRTVLVQAAAISPPTLADFTSLRDLAWDTIPYVCVRDEDGNRWFANVTVPTGRVKTNKRELYLADLNIVEVTATAATVAI